MRINELKAGDRVSDSAGDMYTVIVHYKNRVVCESDVGVGIYVGFRYDNLRCPSPNAVGRYLSKAHTSTCHSAEVYWDVVLQRAVVASADNDSTYGVDRKTVKFEISTTVDIEPAVVPAQPAQAKGDWNPAG